MTADSELRRTHPSTVAVRTLKTAWQGLLAGIAFAIFGAIEGGGWVAGGIFALVMLATLLGAGSSWLKWYFFRFGVVGNDLLITEGWLVRKRRSIPLARVQGVDLRADVFMRIFGLVALTVQTAGGAGEPEATIGEIPLAEAERLRFILLHGRTYTEPPAPETAEGIEGASASASSPAADITGRMSDLRGVFGGAEQARVEPSFQYRVSVARLALAAVTSRTVLVVMAAMLAAATQVFEFAGPDALDAAERTISRLGVMAVLLSALPVLVVTALIAIAVSVSRDYGFVARRVAERVETEAGLFERRMTGVPVGRIQAVAIDEAPLRRALGWASVQVITAGAGYEKQSSASASSVVPIARRGELFPVLHGLIPEVARLPRLAPLPHRAVRFYLTIPTLVTVTVFASAALTVSLVADELGWWVVAAGLVTLVLVAVSRVLSWRNSAIGADAGSLGIASGVLGRRRVRIARSRIQSLTVRQSPFQRRAGLATVVAAGVSGSSAAHYVVRHIEASDADRVIRWYSNTTE